MALFLLTFTSAGILKYSLKTNIFC